MRTGLHPEGRWVSCGWGVTTYGMAYISGKDIRTLETEGRDLEATLRRGAPITPGATPMGALAGEVQPGGTRSDPTLLQAAMVGRRVASVGRRGTFDRSDEDLLTLRAEIDGPSLALMVVGLLMIAGHAIVVSLGLSHKIDSGLSGYAVPGLIIGLAMFVGGLNLRLLWSHGWALLGAFAGLVPLSPAWPLTIIVGMWAWYVLDRKHVRRAFIDRARQRVEAERLRTEPRFSRKAILGFCCAPLMILLPLAFLPTGGPNRFASWQYPLMFTLGPLGAVAPFATTILGWLAVHDIRHSRGRITGLGLALFAALVYPLLVLNGVLVTIVMYLGHESGASSSRYQGPALAVTLLVGCVLSGLLVLWVLRKLRIDDMLTESGSDAGVSRSPTRLSDSDPDLSRGGRDWVTLTMEQIDNDDLPDVCIYCGTPTLDRINRDFSWQAGWATTMSIIGFICGVIPGLIIMALTEKSQRIACPVCPAHRNHRSRLVWFASLGWLLPLAVAGLGALIGWALDAQDIGAFPAIGGFVGFLIGLAIYVGVIIYLSSGQVSIKSMTSEDVMLEHVSPVFAREVRRQQRAKNAPSPAATADA